MSRVKRWTDWTIERWLVRGVELSGGASTVSLSRCR
jgi:hypothetical protein